MKEIKRDILFRGKRLDNGEWVQGLFTKQNYLHFVLPVNSLIGYGVDEDTVGQYTGVNDVNNVQMVEDDIVNVLIGKLSPFAEPIGFNAVVVFRDGAFGFKYYRGVVEEFIPFASCYKPNVTFTVIGNIHDNAELMGDI